jgi:DNA repair exonuclease SbcCD ATPase subunit
MVSAKDQTIHTLQQQLSQLTSERDQLAPAIQTGRDVLSIQEQDPALADEIHQLIRKRQLEKSQPQLTEAQKKVQAAKDQIDHIKATNPDADTSVLETMLAALESQAQVNPAQPVLSEVSQLKTQLDAVQKSINQSVKDRQQEEGMRKLENIQNAAAAAGIEIKPDDWRMDSIVGLVKKGMNEVDAFREVYGVEAPQAPGNEIKRPEADTVTVEDVPISMQPRGEPPTQTVLADRKAKMERIYGPDALKERTLPY